MFSIFIIFKKKKIVPHIRLSGIIGSVGRFRQGLNFEGQKEIIENIDQLKEYPIMEYRVVELLKEIKSLITNKPKPEKWLDLSQAADYTNCSKTTLSWGYQNYVMRWLSI